LSDRYKGKKQKDKKREKVRRPVVVRYEEGKVDGWVCNGIMEKGKDERKRVSKIERNKERKIEWGMKEKMLDERVNDVINTYQPIKIKYIFSTAQRFSTFKGSSSVVPFLRNVLMQSLKVFNIPVLFFFTINKDQVLLCDRPCYLWSIGTFELHCRHIWQRRFQQT
jgi:hypothetical protein